MADALRHFWSTWCNPQKRCHAAVKRYRQKCVFTPTGIGVNSSIGGSRIPPLSPQASHFHNPESRVLTILGTFGLRGSRRNGEGGESEGERLADFYQNFVSCLCWLNFYLRFFAVGGKALDRDEHVRWSAIHSGELEGRSAFGGTFSGGTRSSGPSLGGTCLSHPLRDVGLSNVIPRARQACPSETSLGGTCLLGPHFARCKVDFWVQVIKNTTTSHRRRIVLIKCV